MMESPPTDTQDVIVDMALTSKNLAEVSLQESCCSACNGMDEIQAVIDSFQTFWYAIQWILDVEF